jgi:shikimate kinase
MKPVFIVGFMGAGKTTFGKKLAAALHRSFIDLDDSIASEVAAEMSLPPTKLSKLIEQIGIDKFRAYESTVLKKGQWEDAVVSTGGGTPCYYDNMDFMNRNGVVVFVDTPQEIILGRLRQSNLEERPLLRGLDDTALKNKIAAMLAARLPYYQKAHLTFLPSTETVSDLARRITTFEQTI